VSTTTPPPALRAGDEPVATLLARLRAELGAEFDASRPFRVSRAPGRLDVMGGIADYTGSLVCEMPLDRAAAVAMQPRKDREVQIFSFNLFDEHRPFTLRIPLEALASQPVEALCREFSEPGRKWAAYVAGCLVALHVHRKAVDRMRHGFNVAVYSDVPMGAGVSSSAAVEVATMINLCTTLGIDAQPIQIAQWCQWAENNVVGAPCGIMDQVTSCVGEAGLLLRMICQPHELQPGLKLPEGVRVIGINSNVKHDVGGPAYTRTRCAAFMGQKIILDTMRQIGEASGHEMIADPMRGYLANLDPDDYKRFFRNAVPEAMSGRGFLSRYGTTGDSATTIDADSQYPVRHATDHHVLEARRVRRFAEFMEQAAARSRAERGLDLDRAGHLMYASHQSYGMDAMLGAPECDILVDLVRRRERRGLYGARITGGGSGGTVAVLCDISDRADSAIEQIMGEYEKRTGRKPEAFRGSSPGAWQTGSVLVEP
jgi:L-arabinokinase